MLGQEVIIEQVNHYTREVRITRTDSSFADSHLVMGISKSIDCLMAHDSPLQARAKFVLLDLPDEVTEKVAQPRLGIVF